MVDNSVVDLNNPYIKKIKWHQDQKRPNQVNYISKSSEHFNIFVPDRSVNQPKPGDYWEIIPPLRLIKKISGGGIYAVKGKLIEHPVPLFENLCHYNNKFQLKPKFQAYLDVKMSIKKDNINNIKFDEIKNISAFNPLISADLYLIKVPISVMSVCSCCMKHFSHIYNKNIRIAIKDNRITVVTNTSARGYPVETTVAFITKVLDQIKYVKNKADITIVKIYENTFQIHNI